MALKKHPLSENKVFDKILKDIYCFSSLSLRGLQMLRKVADVKICNTTFPATTKESQKPLFHKLSMSLER